MTRRTRKDKESAQHSYRYSGKGSKARKNSKTSSGQSLFFYKPSLIAKDLIKTVVVSGLILGIELVLYYYLR